MSDIKVNDTSQNTDGETARITTTRTHPIPPFIPIPGPPPPIAPFCILLKCTKEREHIHENWRQKIEAEQKTTTCHNTLKSEQSLSSNKQQPIEYRIEESLARCCWSQSRRLVSSNEALIKEQTVGRTGKSWITKYPSAVSSHNSNCKSSSFLLTLLLLPSCPRLYS